MTADRRLDDDILILNDELIFGSEFGGEDAILSEPGVLLLSKELLPEPVIKKVDVGPRVTGFAPAQAVRQTGGRVVTTEGWHITEPPKEQESANWPDVHAASNLRPATRPFDSHAVPAGHAESDAVDLTSILSEAQKAAAEYGLMQGRTRKALYQALGRTYDLMVYAEDQPAEA